MFFSVSGSLSLYGRSSLLGLPFEVVMPNDTTINKKIEFAKSINVLGGVELTPQLDKIIHLYAAVDISHEVAVFAVKQELKNG